MVMYWQASHTGESTICEPSSSGGDPTSESSEDVQKIVDDMKDSLLEDKPQADPTDEESGAANEIYEDGVLEYKLENQQREPLGVEHHQDAASPEPESDSLMSPRHVPEVPLYDDPSDDDDGDGEWITPTNVALHKSRALDLLPSADASRKGKGKQDEEVAAGCMTADFAMQNVLLQMGLSLVGVEGKRIQKVKTWVLRCHACFK